MQKHTGRDHLWKIYFKDSKFLLGLISIVYYLSFLLKGQQLSSLRKNTIGSSLVEGENTADQNQSKAQPQQIQISNHLKYTSFAFSQPNVKQTLQSQGNTRLFLAGGRKVMITFPRLASLHKPPASQRAPHHTDPFWHWEGKIKEGENSA